MHLTWICPLLQPSEMRTPVPLTWICPNNSMDINKGHQDSLICPKVFRIERFYCRAIPSHIGLITDEGMTHLMGGYTVYLHDKLLKRLL